MKRLALIAITTIALVTSMGHTADGCQRGYKVQHNALTEREHCFEHSRYIETDIACAEAYKE